MGGNAVGERQGTSGGSVAPVAETDAVAYAATNMPVRVVGLGGTLRENSSSEVVLRLALRHAESLGAEVTCFVGEDLRLPLYDPSAPLAEPAPSNRLLDSVRHADALIICSPGYHGTVSGLVKNALDYFEELRNDVRPYVDGMPIGCLAVAHGWQGAVNTLRTLRDISHALRGVPVPYGAVINSGASTFSSAGTIDAISLEHVERVAEQVVSMARLSLPTDAMMGRV